MARLTNVDTQIVSLVKRGAVRDPDNPSEPQTYLLWKSEDAKGGETIKKEAVMADPTIEEVTAALAKAEQERDEAVTKAEAAETKVTELEKAQPSPAQVHTDDDDDLEKSDLPESIKARLRKADEREAEALKKAEEATTLAKAERDLRIEREFITKAENDFAYVGGDTREFGKLLKSASENLSKDDYDRLEEVLKAADKGLEKSELFTEIGKSGEATREARDGIQKAEDKAAELRKADPTLSRADALAQAYRTDPAFAGSR